MTELQCFFCIRLYEIDEIMASDVRSAVTVYNGKALCRHHLDWVRGITDGTPRCICGIGPQEAEVCPVHKG